MESTVQVRQSPGPKATWRVIGDRVLVGRFPHVVQSLRCRGVGT
jgi:hypothetical protein